MQVGAAVLGVRVKATIKEVRADGLVVRTLERASLWEVQTPQARGGHCLLEAQHEPATCVAASSSGPMRALCPRSM